MKLTLSTLISFLTLTSHPNLGSNHLFVSAQVESIAPVCETTHTYTYDSGYTSSTSNTISYPSSPWIQLDLSQTTLANNAKLILKGEYTTQELTADSLTSENGYSAVFDGESVQLELVSPGNGVRNGNLSRVVVTSLKVGLCPEDPTSSSGGGGGEDGEDGGDVGEDGEHDGTDGPPDQLSSICATIDDRVQSYDVRAGRIGGCTGWLVSENVFIQAGHCGTPGSNTRIHFTPQRTSAPAADQYAVDVSTYRGLSTGVGRDWGAGRLLKNSGTQKLPGVAQEEKCMALGEGQGCGWYTIGVVPETTSGNNIRITGYGTAEVDSRSQKTHMDALTTVAGTYLRYVPDTTGGNSGSPVIHEETGHAVGVHTHGGCDGGGNHGTRIDRTDFASHLDFLLRDCTQNSDCDDGLFCNGAETCDANGQCQFGTPPTCNDGLACTDDVCNESLDRCENPVTNCLASGDPCATDQCIEAKGGCQFTCGATLESWMGITGTTIANLMSGTNNLATEPTTSVRLGSGDLLEAPTNLANDYGSRLSGWLVAPVTGDYEFWIASDDNGQFWLSTDANEANTRMVAHVPGWSSSKQWDKFPNDQHSLPYYGVISLVEGVAYYYEALFKEGGGGDNLAIAWAYPGQTQVVIPASASLMTAPEIVTSPPSASPTTAMPTTNPTNVPTSEPSFNPTAQPTSSPSKSPSKSPTPPTNPPTRAPTVPPTLAPTSKPSTSPTNQPTSLPTTSAPSAQPTSNPTGVPSSSPSKNPTSPPVPDPTSSPTQNCRDLGRIKRSWDCPNYCVYVSDGRNGKCCVNLGATETCA